MFQPPGYPRESCQSKFVQLESGDADVTQVFNINVPDDYVAESKRVQVQATGKYQLEYTLVHFSVSVFTVYSVIPCNQVIVYILT